MSFSATDICDDNPDITAVIQIPTMPKDAIIKVEIDDENDDDGEAESKITFDLSKNRILVEGEGEGITEEQLIQMLKKAQDMGGVSVTNGQVLKLQLKSEKDEKGEKAEAEGDFRYEFIFEAGVLKKVKVTIWIYDAMGRTVRTLALGHKEAGFYLSRERAAYWDGRNEAGERVASGVYFYQLQAGSFSVSDMRKMLMVK